MPSEVVVVMVPFVAQGHLNQLLHLSRHISAYNLPIHCISTATHIRQARHRLHGWNMNQADTLIQFHEVPDPEFTSPEPDPNSTIEFPTHLQPLFDASLNLRHPVTDIIRSLAQTSRKVVVVHDSAMSYVVQDVKHIPNAETYVFHAPSVLFRLCITLEILGRELPETVRRLPSSVETMSQEFMQFAISQVSHQTFHVGNIYDSSRVIEASFIQSLEKNGGKHWAVGPFNPVDIQSHEFSSSHDQVRHTCLKWLDEQPEKSVIYISFGTSVTFSDSQIRELAVGLERSEQRFLWVLRDADKADVSENGTDRKAALPEGFEDRVVGRGLVVREWAPQMEILGHWSTGGFVSHCGWNSCMEAMTSGVPIAAWPIHSDQPHNAFLLVEVLKVALMMREWASKERLLTSEMVEKVVRKLIDSEEGALIRARAVDLSGELRRSMAEGGVSREELDSLVARFLT